MERVRLESEDIEWIASLAAADDAKRRCLCTRASGVTRARMQAPHGSRRPSRPMRCEGKMPAVALTSESHRTGDNAANCSSSTIAIASLTQSLRMM
jgi:hypothetical protein